MAPSDSAPGLRWLRATATFIFIAALCLAVAVLVIALVPGSPVTQELPAATLTGFDGVGGVTAGVAVDPSGWIPFHDPGPVAGTAAALPADRAARPGS